MEAASGLAQEYVSLVWGERTIQARVCRTQRRVLKIDVLPAGDVVVYAPNDADLAEIKARVARKRAWIFTELDRIAARPSVTPTRAFVSGETHLFLGRQYRLCIERSDDPRVVIEGGRLRVHARDPENVAHCRRLLTAFYRLHARSVFHDRLDVVLAPFARRGLRRPQLIVLPMTKRWGSYTPTGRIVLNVDLIRADPDLIDYVICHELVHAFHSNHGPEWRRLFDSIMPDWETRKAKLESLLR